MNQTKKSILHNKLVLFFLLLLVGLIVYLPSLKVNFLNDEIYFLERNSVENFASLLSLLEKKDYDEIYYRPIVNLISGIQTLIFNFNALPYRLINIILHCTNSFLIFLLINLLFNKNNRVFEISFFSALIFLTHPIHDYAVIWQTDLFDRIMTLFYVTSIILFIRQNKILSYLFFLLALLSKEMAFSLPFVIFIISFYKSDGKVKEKILYSLNNFYPYLIIVILLILFRYTVLKNYFLYDSQFHSNLSVVNAVKNYFIYFGLTFFPFYIREIQEFIILYRNYLIILLPIPLIFLYILIKYKGNLKLELFGFCFFSLTIFLVLRQLMRWYLYLPSIGIILICISLLSRLKNKIIFYLASLTIIITFSITLNLKLNNWIMASQFVDTQTENIITQLANEQADEILFLNLPAKWNDVPIFQLGFEHHLRHYLRNNCDVKVLTKVYLNSLTEVIKLETRENHFMLKLIEPSYFILTSEEFLSQRRVPKINDTLTYDKSKIILKKVDKFNRPNGIELILNDVKPYTKIFLFSKGSFQKIKL